MATATKKKTRSARKAPTNGRHLEPFAAHSYPNSGAFFKWRFQIGNSQVGEREVMLECFVATPEQWEREKGQHIAGHTKAVAVGNGMVAIATVDADCRTRDEEEHNPDNAPTVKAIRDSLLAWLESQERVSSMNVFLDVAGACKFEFRVDGTDTDEGCPIELELRHGC